MRTITTGGRTVSVFPSATPGAPVIYLNTFSGEGERVFQAALAAGCPPFTLAAVSDLDWNRDMAPRDCPRHFKTASPALAAPTTTWNC